MPHLGLTTNPYLFMQHSDYHGAVVLYLDVMPYDFVNVYDLAGFILPLGQFNVVETTMLSCYVSLFHNYSRMSNHGVDKCFTSFHLV